MELHERLKMIRKAVSQTQNEFSQSLGIPKRTYIAYEYGENPIPERLIVSICAIHGVDEHWLRTGEGEMFPQKSEDPLWALLGEVLKEEKSSFRRQLITSLCQLDVEEIKVFEKFIDKFLAEREKAKKEEG